MVDKYSRTSYTSLGIGLVSFLLGSALQTMIIVRDPLLLFTELNLIRGEDDKNKTCEMFAEHGKTVLEQADPPEQSVNIDALYAHMARQRASSAILRIL